ncbi:unnamed protein product [Rotaria magnacalcarata]|nr:unnamed protein product [Rotaria magnacalcarata]
MTASRTRSNHTKQGTEATKDKSTHSVKQSDVWKYFQRIDSEEKLYAKCLVQKCPKLLSTPQHSTTTLFRHLRDVHKIDEFRKKKKEKIVHNRIQKRIPEKLKRTLDRAIVKAIVEDGRSFGDFSKSGFRKFIELALPSYKPPRRNTISTQIRQLHAKYFISLVDSLSNVAFISISTDFWSDTKGISYLVLTGHYITNAFDLKSTILRFSTFQQRHYSDLIGIEIEKQLLELKIFDKVVSITCDGARNMVKMFDFFSRTDVTRVRCQAHLLHLIVYNGLGLWMVTKRSISTNDTNDSIDPEEGFNHSLKKIVVSGDEELSTAYDDAEQSTEMTDQNSEDNQYDNVMDQDDQNSSSDDDDDSNFSGSESDCEDLSEVFEDNFAAGIDTNFDNDPDSALPQPDSRISLVVQKVRQLVVMIKGSLILSSFIQKIKHEYNRNNDKPIKRSLILDVRTRWNSTYKMLDTMKIYQPIVDELFRNKANLSITKKQQQRLASLEFTSDCWYTIELLIKVLQPFYAATKTISVSDYPSIGVILFIFRRLDKDFLSKSTPTDDPLFNNMKKCLLNKMNYYNTMQDPSQTKTILFHAFFDPYGLSVMTNTEINVIENEIKQRFRRQASNGPIQASATSATSPNGPSTNKNEKKRSLLNYFLKSLDVEDIQQTKKQPSSFNKKINDERKAYNKLASSFVSTSSDTYDLDSLKFWKKSMSSLPNLAPLAQKYLAVPSTSTKSEAAFSTSTYYGLKQRARLSSDNLCFSVFLKDKLSNEDKENIINI